MPATAVFPHLMPGQIFCSLIFILLFVFVFKNNLTFQGMIATMNAMESQPMALLVLVIGCIMMFYFPDSKESIAIISCAFGLLKGEMNMQKTRIDQSPLPPATSSNNDTKAVPPTEPPANEEGHP